MTVMKQGCQPRFMAPWDGAVFRGFPVLFRMRWGRAGRGRPGGDRRPGRVEEAFRQSRARRDEGRGGPARLPWRRCGRHR